MKFNTARPSILFLFILFIISLTARGQDFITVRWITPEGDTIPGLIKNKVINEQFLIAKNDISIRETYQLAADNVKSVLFNGDRIYQSTTVFFKGKKANIFIELVLKGDVNLYSGSYKELGKLFFIEKNHEIYMIGKTNINGFLKNLLGECFNETIIKKDLYVESDLKKAVLLYNNCVHPDAVSNYNPINKFRIQFYAGGKINYNNGKFNFSPIAYYKNGDYSRISSFGAGLMGGMNLTKRLFIQTELSYLKKVSESDYVNTSAFDSAISSQVRMDFTYLDWPLYIGYFLSQGNIRPYIAAGLNMGFMLSGGIQDNPYMVDPADFGPPFVKFDSFDFGLLGLAGVMVNINKKSAFQVNIKYCSTDTDYYVSRNSNVLGGYGAGSSNLNTKRLEVSVEYVYLFIK